MDPTTFEACDGCAIQMPDFARVASEYTTKTGHAGCMAAIDHLVATQPAFDPEGADRVVYLTDYADQRAKRLQDAKDRHPSTQAQQRRNTEQGENDDE